MASMPVRPDRPPPPCPSWVFSDKSDTHVAKDRWGRAEVIGMGTVDLATMSPRTQTDPGSPSTLRLKNVLHAPAALCNIIGKPVTEDYTVIRGTTDSDHPGFIVKNTNGNIVAYFKPKDQGPDLYQVQLGEPPLGHEFGISPLCPNGNYLIHAFFSQRERHRFVILKFSGLIRASGVEPFTPTEKKWFGKNRMSEKAIRVAYGLDPNRKEHQEECRAIMRILKCQAENEPILLPY
ncbi:hypothetical protein PENFLA_c013G04949 [Penicillium flavigenum]|uniref:Uncharacterized protein n=1 Tax=Penicillium flavigenum TaxID=254877 RepID=A0A1V6T801_9EURO|nr:hypothetical protein PENFLA_c013G04949 [Penicillium flavigenum]